RFGLWLRWCVLRNLWDRRGGWLLGEKATGRAKQAGHQQGKRDEKLRFSWTFHGLPARILSVQDARASLMTTPLSRTSARTTFYGNDASLLALRCILWMQKQPYPAAQKLRESYLQPLGG